MVERWTIPPHTGSRPSSDQRMGQLTFGSGGAYPICYTDQTGAAPRPLPRRTLLYSRWLRNSFIYLLILVAVVAIVFAFFNSGSEHEKICIGQGLSDIKAGEDEAL